MKGDVSVTTEVTIERNGKIDRLIQRITYRMRKSGPIKRNSRDISTSTRPAPKLLEYTHGFGISLILEQSRNWNRFQVIPINEREGE